MKRFIVCFITTLVLVLVNAPTASSAPMPPFGSAFDTPDHPLEEAVLSLFACFYGFSQETPAEVYFQAGSEVNQGVAVFELHTDDPANARMYFRRARDHFLNAATALYLNGGAVLDLSAVGTALTQYRNGQIARPTDGDPGTSELGAWFAFWFALYAYDDIGAILVASAP